MAHFCNFLFYTYVYILLFVTFFESADFNKKFTWILEYGSFKSTQIFKSIVFLGTEIQKFKVVLR